MAVLWLRRLKLRTFHAGVVLGFFTSYLLPSVQAVFFERLEAFGVRAGMVRGPEFRLSVKIPRRHQTTLQASGGCLSPGNHGIVSFSSLSRGGGNVAPQKPLCARCRQSKTASSIPEG
jgi:hypothetical protein